jgi:hypothetical protein
LPLDDLRSARWQIEETVGIRRDPLSALALFFCPRGV